MKLLTVYYVGRLYTIKIPQQAVGSASKDSFVKWVYGGNRENV